MTGTVNPDLKKIFRSLLFPLIFVGLIWMVYALDMVFSLDLNRYGLIPLKPAGLVGIFTAPFLHGDLSHLFANTFPLLLLGAMLFYFYTDIAWPILLLIYLLSGIWVWFFARGDAIHIGASGIIYGLASFLFFSGIIRRETGLMVSTLLVAFLYGGLIWGIFPHFFPHRNISWESHFMGLLAGLVLAFYYRGAGPQRKRYDWEDEDENEDGGNESATSMDPNEDMDAAGERWNRSSQVSP